MEHFYTVNELTGKDYDLEATRTPDDLASSSSFSSLSFPVPGCPLIWMLCFSM